MKINSAPVNKTRIFAVVLILSLFSAAATAVYPAQDYAEKFKKTEFYTKNNFFDSASVSGSGNLILEASARFTALKADEKNRL